MRVKWVIAVGIVCVLVAACGGGSDGNKNPATTTTTTGADADLGQILIADGPPGLTPVAEGGPGTGPFDLDGAVTYLGDSHEGRELLTSSEFEAGHARSWAIADPLEALIVKVQR